LRNDMELIRFYFWQHEKYVHPDLPFLDGPLYVHL
jgi:hypothetical protein